MRTIYNMSIEELLDSNRFKTVGKESERHNDVYYANHITKLSDIGSEPSVNTLTITCPTVVAQKTAPVTSVTVTFRSNSQSGGPTGWSDLADVSITTGDGWGDQPDIPITIDGGSSSNVARTPNTTTNFSAKIEVFSTGAIYHICADATCYDYTSSIVPANITCTSFGAPTIPNLTEIDINFTWTNTGGASASFTPAVNITSIGTINLTVSPVAMGPGATHNETKALTGLSLSSGASYTVCPVPN